MAIPSDLQVGAVRIASPDLPTRELTEVPFNEANGWVEFPVSVQQYSLVAVQWT
jgi:hypothetical protein